MRKAHTESRYRIQKHVFGSILARKASHWIWQINEGNISDAYIAKNKQTNSMA
jgi:hypothetical protein